MIYLILSQFLFNFASAQTTPILILEQYSGRTSAKNAMEAHCMLDNSNHINGTFFRDYTNDTWQSELNINELVPVAEFNQVQAWILLAAMGPYKQTINPCDIGSLKIITNNYPLILSSDCGTRIENQDPSAIKLVEWFRKACLLEKKSNE